MNAYFNLRENRLMFILISEKQVNAYFNFRENKLMLILIQEGTS